MTDDRCQVSPRDDFKDNALVEESRRRAAEWFVPHEYEWNLCSSGVLSTIRGHDWKGSRYTARDVPRLAGGGPMKEGELLQVVWWCAPQPQLFPKVGGRAGYVHLLDEL